MLNHIQKIRSVGCYDEFDFDAASLKPFNKVNILYGSNGCGKTTLSNVFYLLSKHCKNKDELVKEIMDADCEVELYINSKKVTQKNITEQNLDLYVFNSKFIADHVYNGNRANIDSFSSDVKLTSPDIDKIDILLNASKKRNQQFTKWREQINSKLDNIFKGYNDEFQKKVSGSRLTGVKPQTTTSPSGKLADTKASLTTLYSEYDKKSKEGNTLEQLDLLLEKVMSIHRFNANIGDIKSGIYTPLSAEAKGKVALRISDFQQKVEERAQLQAVGDLSNWFRVGGRLLHFSKEIQKSCPLCNTDLSDNIDSIVAEYTAYFSDALVSLFKLIDDTLLICRLFSEQEQSKKNEEIVNDIIGTAIREYNLTLNCETGLDFDLFIGAVKEFQTALIEKRNAPEAKVIISEESTDIVSRYNKRLQNFIEAAAKKIANEKDRLKSRNLEFIIKDIKNTIAKACTLELNEGINTIFRSVKVNSTIAELSEKHIESLTTQIVRLQVEKDNALVKLNTESKYINIYLKHFGIDHFSIDRDKNKMENNVIVTYSKTGRKKTSFHHSLSEGEKLH